MKIKENVISFSLWGKDARYIDGALENISLASEMYPGWQVRIYVDNTVCTRALKEMHTAGADMRLIRNSRGSFHGAFWRFLVNDDDTVDRFIIRDIDSRLNFREQVAVNEWIESDKSFHIMRDHVNHRYAIQAGMWGGKAGKVQIWPLVNQWSKFDYYSCDEHFLQNVFYAKIKDDVLVHDPYIENKPFPSHKPIYNNGTFVGQTFLKGVPQLV
jgi:hypothetical protein